MDELEFYRQHSPLTDPGRHRDLIAGTAPSDLVAMCELIQDAVCHRDETKWRFGFDLPEPRRDEANTRYLRDRRSARQLRSAGRRSSGSPAPAGTSACSPVRCCARPAFAARMRAGFAGYFQPGFFVDHWVVELWHESGQLAAAGRPGGRATGVTTV